MALEQRRCNSCKFNSNSDPQHQWPLIQGVAKQKKEKEIKII
jgi:hypothetical protein